jgi:3'-phosphoadenosine 5'-phosphosulfate sulfotransferase (PAPS reductase)/FAD synthetase
MNNKEYHILSLSGGKDSTALAFYIKDNMPEVHEKVEYVFCDTECELPDTYEYLDKIEIFLDKQITRLKPYKSFEHLMEVHGYLPSLHCRWCTVEMKTKPFRKYVYDKLGKNDGVINMYIGIRADEAHRATPDKGNGDTLKAIFPFVENGLNEREIHDILEKSGIGLPEYYKWNKRSGCYFCFFQSKLTWINLYEKYPDLFAKAKAIEDERNSNTNFKKVSWHPDITLEEMIKPENIKDIKEKYRIKAEKKAAKLAEKSSNTLFDIIDDEGQGGCLMCHI